jgi:hypothetical protein
MTFNIFEAVAALRHIEEQVRAVRKFASRELSKGRTVRESAAAAYLTKRYPDLSAEDAKSLVREAFATYRPRKI